MPLNPLDVEGLMQQCQVELPGASINGIKAKMYEVMSEFFKDSNSWIEDISFAPQANTTSYPLSPLDGGQVIRLIGVWDQTFVPIPAFMPVFGTVQLVSASSTLPSGSPWLARFVKNIMPPTTSDNVPDAPDWTLRVYRDVILAGIVGQLKNEHEKSYSDAQGALYHLRRFRTGITNARVAAARDNIVGGQEWSYPRQGIPKTSQRGGVSTAWPTRAF